MDQILIFINNWGTIIAGIFTAFGTIYLFVKRLMKKLKPHLEILENLQKLTVVVDSIHKEFKPNCGGSFSDKITALSKDVKTNTELTHQIFNRTKFLIETHSAPILEFNSAGDNIWSNRAFLDLVGRQQSEIADFGWATTILEEKREEILNSWNEAVKSKKGIERTIWLVSKTGKEYVCKMTASKSNDSGGYVACLTQINPL
jgi:PAS domain-containing protein